MCLGVPGKVVSIEPDAFGVKMGTVSFGGIRKQVCLAYLPEVEVDEYVIVHVGFAISKIDEKEAQEVFEILRKMDELNELDPPGSVGTEPA